MAGHSHWAGIKHKKSRQDSLRSKIFSKISREITVAAKLGSKDPQSNHRLRAAIESAKEANMPKENINRAIRKSEVDKDVNFESLRYEGFGPINSAIIIEAVTDNKNRTASKIRTTLQKFGGNLGSTGSTSHLFKNCGIIRFTNKTLSDDNILDFSAKVGALDFLKNKNFFEIITKKQDFYRIKNEIEKLASNIIYSGIEWKARDFICVKEEDWLKLNNMISILDEDDDIQSIFHNCKILQI